MARCGCTSGCACLLHVIDTATLDLHITGSGSSIDPYVISGDVTDIDVTPLITVDDLAPFALPGSLMAPTIGTLRFRFPFTATLVGVSASVNTAPTDANIIVDVNKNGSTIFTISTKPTIIAGAFDTGVSEFVPDITAVVSGDYLQVDVDQVGATAPGSNLMVFVRYSRIF